MRLTEVEYHMEHDRSMPTVWAKASAAGYFYTRTSGPVCRRWSVPRFPGALFQEVHS